MKTKLPLLVAALCSLAPATGMAQPVDCAAQAVQQSGYNPNGPAPATAQASPQVAGSGSRARGAAAGAVIAGASGGDAGRAAAAGAVAGGVAQRSRNRRSARSQNEAIQQQQQSGRAAYDQALAACLAAHPG